MTESTRVARIGRCRTATYDLPFRFAARGRNVLALAVREATTNVVRHARATRCRIGLSLNGTEVWLEVEDDGVGRRGPAGAGLTGMRERIAEIRRALEVLPARFATRGTLVRARIPKGVKFDATAGAAR